jgi:hypothetical protein
LSLVGSEENLAARRTRPAPAFAAFRQGDAASRTKPQREIQFDRPSAPELAEARLIFFGVRSAALRSPQRAGFADELVAPDAPCGC